VKVKKYTKTTIYLTPFPPLVENQPCLRAERPLLTRSLVGVHKVKSPRNSFAYVQKCSYWFTFLLTCNYMVIEVLFCLCADPFLSSYSIAYAQSDVYWIFLLLVCSQLIIY